MTYEGLRNAIYAMPEVIALEEHQASVGVHQERLSLKIGGIEVVWFDWRPRIVCVVSSQIDPMMCTAHVCKGAQESTHGAFAKYVNLYEDGWDEYCLVMNYLLAYLSEMSRKVRR